MAVELKHEVNSDPRKKFHLLRSLKRAAKYADKLLRVYNSLKPVRDVMQEQDLKHRYIYMYVHCTCHIDWKYLRVVRSIFLFDCTTYLSRKEEYGCFGNYMNFLHRRTVAGWVPM